MYNMYTLQFSTDLAQSIFKDTLYMEYKCCTLYIFKATVFSIFSTKYD